MRADLDRPVAGVHEHQAAPLVVRAAALSSIVPGRIRIAPGASARRRPVIACRRPRAFLDRLVQGDELAAVGEGGLDLHVREHLGDAGHHLVAGQHLPALLHQVRHGAPSRARSITQVVSSATVSG